MSLKEMIHQIQDEVSQEVAAQINKVKILHTQELIELGESLDLDQEEKFYHLKNQLKKKEVMLKAEQDFLISHQLLLSEDAFVEELLIDIKQCLLEYPTTHFQKYKLVLQQWIQKISEVFSDEKCEFLVQENDYVMVKELLAQNSLKTTLAVSPKVHGGLWVKNDKDVIIDLTLNTLFEERKQQILNISLQILKESL